MRTTKSSWGEEKGLCQLTTEDAEVEESERTLRVDRGVFVLGTTTKEAPMVSPGTPVNQNQYTRPVQSTFCSIVLEAGGRAGGGKGGEGRRHSLASFRVASTSCAPRSA